MGYAWQGVCYRDTSAARDAFAVSLPSADAAGIISFTAAPTINASGLLSWSISHRPLTGTTATTRTGTTQLVVCTEPDFSQWSEQSMLFYIALVLAALMGFAAGYRR